MDLSRRKYASALTRTNAALACPKSAVLDKTLASVLLLGLFEAIVFQGRKSPENWTTHTLGAVGLLRIRGTRQFESNKIAQQLFAQTANNIRTSCFQRRLPVPAEFIELNAGAVPFLNAKDPAVRLGPILDKAASIRARQSKSHFASLMYEALDLDDEVVDLIGGFEDELLYTQRTREDTPSWAYLGTASRYPSRRAAKFWNAIRMLRVFLNEVIWAGALLASSNMHNDKERAAGDDCENDYLMGVKDTAASNMAEIATEILASVPDFIEEHAPGQRFYPSARTLVWPLMVLEKSPICPPAPAKYARCVLARLASDLNMREVGNTFKAAGKPVGKEDWSVKKHKQQHAS